MFNRRNKAVFPTAESPRKPASDQEAVVGQTPPPSHLRYHVHVT